MRSSRARGCGWTRYDDSSATTEDFQAVMEEASGEQLDNFFNAWLRAPARPAEIP